MKGKKFGSISVSGQLPTYPSPNLTSQGQCCVRGGVSGQFKPLIFSEGKVMLCEVACCKPHLNFEKVPLP